MDETRRSRRRFLAAVGTGLATGVAGCAGGDDPETRAGTATTDRTTSTRTRAATATLPESPGVEPFSQFRGGPRRRGYYPDERVPGEVSVDWSIPDVNTGDHTAAKSSFVPLPSGDLVVPGDTGNVHRVTPDGEVVWSAPTDRTGRGIHGTPVVANGAVYVGAYDGALYAFEAESGGLIWRSDLGDAIGSSPTYRDGTVYVAVEYFEPSGSMFGVDAATGAVEWEDDRPRSHPHSTCALDTETGYLVVGCNDANVYGWTWPDLEHAWTFETGKDVKGPIAIHDGSAYFGSWDGFVYSVDLETGEQEWFYRVIDYVMSGPAVDLDRGRLYFGGHDGFLHALELDTGQRVWRYGIGGEVLGCPTVTSDKVLCGTTGRKLAAVDRDSGDRVWTVSTDGWVTSTPRVRDGAVYFTERASEDASGHAYRLVEA